MAAFLKKNIHLVAITLLAWQTSSSSALARQWSVQYVTLSSPPVELLKGKRHTDLTGIEILGKDGSISYLDNCAAKLCVKTTRRKNRLSRLPRNAIPDAIPSFGQRIAQAWLSDPTRRYAHGVLGDKIEAGSLSIIDIKRNRYELKLPLTSVFEDLRVRLADLDGDGEEEIAVVRSYVDRGAALAIVELTPNGPIISAETDPIGMANRWLNPAGIADYDGDGKLEIAIVVTPHIGGRLEFWEYRARKLYRKMVLQGFSNHFIGSTVQQMSVTGDFDGDGIDDLALPDASRTSLRLISIAGGKAAETARIKLPAKIVTQILTARSRPDGALLIIAGLDDGRIAVMRRLSQE